MNKTIFTTLLFAALLMNGSAYALDCFQNLQDLGNGDVTVATDCTVTINQTHSLEDELGNPGSITIEAGGKLECDDTAVATVTVGKIKVEAGGEFICGTAGDRFDGDMKFLLKGPEKEIKVLTGGTIKLHGKDTAKAGYTRLDADMQVGDDLVIPESDAIFENGDQIVISTTKFDPNQNEKFNINESAGFWRTHRGTLYEHNGTKQDFYNANNFPQGGNIPNILDERAYIINLNRNITIQGFTDDDWSNDGIGAHMMFHEGSAAYIDAIEIHRGGHKTVMGRYPIHWHKAGNVGPTGQYVKHSSIHRSVNRCITVHQTHKLLVDKNSCYDIVGHAIFLEDGNEIENVITNNISILTKRPSAATALLITDWFNFYKTNRFMGPAAFWISHPFNIVDDNVAVASEGTGFWNSFVHYLRCNGTPLEYSTDCVWKPSTAGANVFPKYALTGSYARNVAASNTIGHTWDGGADGVLAEDYLDHPQFPTGLPNPAGHSNNRLPVNTRYEPRADSTPTGPLGHVPYVEHPDLVAYKSARAGIYYRGDPALFEKAVFADNGWSIFVAYNQIFKDSLIVGFSDNHDQSEIDYHYNENIPNMYRHGKLFAASNIYDGPQSWDNIYLDFPANKMYYDLGGSNEEEVTPTVWVDPGGGRHFSHTVENIHYRQEPYRRVIMEDSQAHHDARVVTSILDKDGSLMGTGVRSYIRPDIEINKGSLLNPLGNSCSAAKAQENALICEYEMAKIRLWAGPEDSDENYDIHRSDGASYIQSQPLPPLTNTGESWDKFAMVANEGLSYELRNLDFENEDFMDVEVYTDDVGDITPIVTISSLVAPPSACANPGDLALRLDETTTDANQVFFMSDLEDEDQVTSFFQDGTDLHFKIIADSTVLPATSPIDNLDGRGLYELYCPSLP